MAQDFTRYKSEAVGTSPVTLHTANPNDVVVGISVANILGSTILVDVYLTNSGTFHLVKSAPIPSGGSLQLLAGGAKGKRFALPHSRVMIHQPLGGFQGQASDIDIHAKEILKIKNDLNSVLAHHTGQTIKTIEKDTDRDNFMDSKTAKEYGLIDDVLGTREK